MQYVVGSSDGEKSAKSRTDSLTECKKLASPKLPDESTDRTSRALKETEHTRTNLGKRGNSVFAWYKLCYVHVFIFHFCDQNVRGFS